MNKVKIYTRTDKRMDSSGSVVENDFMNFEQRLINL